MLLQNVEQYVEKLIPKRQELIEEMEAYAKEHHVPIMELIGVETLLQILRLHQPKHILEIGTAIAYSSIRITHALPEARVVTVERNEERYQKRKSLLNGRENKIKLCRCLEMHLSLEMKLNVMVLMMQSLSMQLKVSISVFRTL